MAVMVVRVVGEWGVCSDPDPDAVVVEAKHATVTDGAVADAETVLIKDRLNEELGFRRQGRVAFRPWDRRDGSGGGSRRWSLGGCD
jgi:hypothetical protein